MARYGEPSGPALGATEISRRDVLNGILLASGGAAVRGSFPLRALAEEMKATACDGSIGADPRALRGGNLSSTFNIAHWMRDRRLQFEPGKVTLAPGCDAFQGSFPICDEGEEFDAIIVGAGLAGLSSAFYLLRKRPKARILLLEANPYAGGNAGRDDLPPLPVVASTAGAYCVAPTTGFLRELYRELKINWKEHLIADPSDSYYFDEYTPGVKAGYRGWNIGTLDVGMKDVPYEKHVVSDLLKSRRAILKLGSGRHVKITDPPDFSSRRYDYLSEVTLEDYLTNTLHCDPIISDFYSLYTIDALGGSAHYVNAHSAISFMSGEFGNYLFAFPGGTSEVARRLTLWLGGIGRSGELGPPARNRNECGRLEGRRGCGAVAAERQRHLFPGQNVQAHHGQDGDYREPKPEQPASRRAPLRRREKSGVEPIQYGAGRYRECRIAKRRAPARVEFRVQYGVVGKSILGEPWSRRLGDPPAQ